ncbi:MAG: type I methionyl aminopeptidase [Candidatus Abyssobacteria bacterium SURF_5]|uniref:Methionine aminopeptidase n=1 Tax=Abyssobacteria bacterium (strain SURF_5) TaxID=2093360 RepID=A0A3A4NM82_ABYX5|nr:MAG: type I methionyl aminopeptidase [Candidatus Abyssubacteria bacterium SURF_5]
MIVIRSEDELAILRAANRIIARILQELAVDIRAGVSTEALDKKAERLIAAAGGKPAFKGYRGYPKTICTSIDEQVVHGIPSSTVILKEGDILSIDIGIVYRGYVGDTAATFTVGEVSDEKKRLIRVTRESLYKGIERAREGNRLSDISHAVQSHVESHRFSVVRDFVGHGIGQQMHEEPQIPNFGRPHLGPRLQAGMVLAIEPMVNAGSYEVRVLDDGWTAVTKDGRPSAHFEHSIAVTKGEAEILSLPPSEEAE